jgi:alkaline phosphatase D
MRLAWLALLALPLPAPAQITRVAFGSCASQEKPLPVFDAIADFKPQLYLALGDNIYADTEDMKMMADKYARMKALPGYAKLRQTCPIIGTWDDHDYGKNDAGVEYPKKKEAQELFHDFFDTPRDSPKRSQEGVYSSAMFGPEGKRVQVIVLDTRYFRSPLRRGKREPGMTYTPYIANTSPDATMLGEAQWKWLGDELRKPAEVRLVVTSIQLVPVDHAFEKWATMPLERERFIKLLAETKAEGVVLLSGDRHLAELSLETEDGVPYPLYDLTSSGLNQASKTWRGLEKNTRRVATMPYGDNFGSVLIDWDAKNPAVTLQIHDEKGNVVIRHDVPLSVLRAGGAALAQKAAPKGTAGQSTEQPTPGEGAISLEEAKKKVGKTVTTELRVGSARAIASGQMFLNSERDFKAKENFTVVLRPSALKGKWEKADASTFRDKVVRVTGKVELFKDTPQIVVTEQTQLELVEDKDKPKE